jgi:GTPase SAR1 family protein
VGAQCGKSSIVHRFLEDEFRADDDPTVGKRSPHEYFSSRFAEDFFKKTIVNESTKEEFLVEILDTSGNDFYASLHDKVISVVSYLTK